MGKKSIKEKYKKFTKDELADEIKRFIKEFNRVPITKDFEKLNGYPSRKTFTNIFGNFNDAIKYAGFEPIGVNFRDNKIKYDKNYLLKKIYEYVDIFGKTPRMKDMTKFLGYEPKIYYLKVFGSWNNALTELGLPLNSVSSYSDEVLESEFKRFIQENGRVPTFREFNNNSYPSFWCYQNRFGSWNDAVKAYGYKVQSDIFNFEVLKTQLLDFCKAIKKKENRDIITVTEIQNYKEIPSYSCFCKHLKLNDYTIKSFLNENGFDIPKEGHGLNFTYLDGEKIKSQHELNFSNYLRNKNLEYNLDYFRDVKYKNFTDNYKGNMNCDYVIKFNNEIIYIEIAGMLRDHKKSYLNNIPITSKSCEIYRQKLSKKEDMLKKQGIKYYILFPVDINEKFLNTIFY
jgi:hypothetical protein